MRKLVFRAIAIAVVVVPAVTFAQGAKTKPTTADVQQGSVQFGSSHTGAVNATMCDGSVRAIRYNPDPELFRRLCVRNDGQVVSGDW